MLWRQIRVSIKRAFILEFLGPFSSRKARHFVSRMKIRRQCTFRTRAKTQAQPASCCVERFFKLDSGKPDFVSITPRQARRLIAKVAVPSQRRLQRKVSLLYKRDHVIRIPPLFRNPNAHESKQYPAKNRSDNRWH